MAEPALITFSYKEVVTALVKQHGLNDGIWGIYFKFGLSGANVGPAPGADIQPAAIVPVLEVGLQKMDEVTNLSVDAAIVNPRKKAASKRHSRGS